MGRCCCCNCLFSCVFACICQVLCAIIIILGVIILALWLIFRPNKVYFHIADASLTKFDFSPTTNTLDYDLSLSVDIRNSNKRIGVYFDKIEAKTTYHRQKFANTNLESFYQDPKNTTILNPVLKGQSSVHLGDSEKSDYDDEKKSGMYKIFTVLYMRIRLKSGWITSGKIKLAAGCELKVPMKSNGGSSGTFERTNCVIIPWARH